MELLKKSIYRKNGGGKPFRANGPSYISLGRSPRIENIKCQGLKARYIISPNHTRPYERCIFRAFSPIWSVIVDLPNLEKTRQLELLKKPTSRKISENRDWHPLSPSPFACGKGTCTELFSRRSLGSASEREHSTARQLVALAALAGKHIIPLVAVRESLRPRVPFQALTHLVHIARDVY